MGAKDRHRPLDERAVLPAGVTITTSGEARLVGRAVVLITGLSSAAVSVSLWLQADIATAARTSSTAGASLRPRDVRILKIHPISDDRERL
jgi:hypothetical protein